MIVSKNERRCPVSDFHSIEMQSITGEPVSLSKYQENLCLIVNVASR
jgi:glutathione peroxidase-family protein